MSRKNKILKMLEKLDDDVSYDKVIYHLAVMRSIEIGSAEADRGEGMEHEEFMEQLLSECQEQRSNGHRVPRLNSVASKTTSLKTAQRTQKGSSRR